MNKGLEKLDIVKNSWLSICGEIVQPKNIFREEFAIIEKELKAVKIMIDELHITDIDFFYDDVENKYYFVGSEVSKDNFDLLKEVILGE